MTGEQREMIKRVRDEKRRRDLEIERVKARRRRGDPTCSRCYRPVTPDERSPGRAWCRDCENKRRDSYRKAAA